ncbi:glycosyl hydrolase family 43 [Chitinophaga polysaccharea]|uniref:Glycosyl hydrolase family 43 n=1 Tax=Chitinophaga polysaccharea TaxID=1293035 RepID=A0A561PUG1_9BACT|nr:discoidin domain-containing protein [Chitinophaga polysaccharea]TWF41740.1 glycosyl hydrolase family 43 [Chitinophaga polysaccharea]
MKIKNLVIGGCLLLSSITGWSQQSSTFCNPLNLNYRFAYGNDSYREAADPVIHLFKGKYYLYASKSGGYWTSDNMLQWKYLPCTTLPVEDYAPAVATIRDTVFFIASQGNAQLYYSTDPQKDNWKVYNAYFPIHMTDPALFRDDDGRVYFYYGCSATNPIMGVELNPNNYLDTIGTPQELITHRFREHGWEEPGENNDKGKAGWNEGSWMNKYKGKYYLQYAAPGTEFKGYGDGVYIADKPLGPFTYMDNSPFSYKPGGFIDGAGHGNTFMDKYGNYWHSATMTISVRHMFERRIGLFPAFFDEQGQLHCLTAFGDYPMTMPNRKMDFGKSSLFTGWMLLSYHKKITASSSLPGHEPALAADENVRTWWSADTGHAGQWLQMDLGKICAVHALQVNFADQDSHLSAIDSIKPYRYKIEGSADAQHWYMLTDKTGNNANITHDYITLAKQVNTRYIRVTAVQVPDGYFSLSDLRVFGKAPGRLPAVVNQVLINRDSADSRHAEVSWQADKSATGYVVYYGTTPASLYTAVMVYGDHRLRLTGLNKQVPYYFRVDAFNECGVSRGK